MRHAYGMARLFVTEELGRVFLEGLVAIARADGVVTVDELNALREVARDLEIAIGAEELLLADDVTPAALAAALAVPSDGAYRGAGTPEIAARTFVEAALRIALADGEIQQEETALLQAFAAALGVETGRIHGWPM
jgi:tellurite resistance protein